MSQKERVDQVKELMDKLEKGVEDVFNSQRYRDYLQTMSRFYRYSFNNTMLIFMQRPDATLVAGYSSWQKNFNRYVKRGEKGIKILAPTPYKYKVEMVKTDPVTKEPIKNDKGKPITELVEISRMAFKPVTVFDVSQTDGEPLPEPISELAGEVKDYNLLFRAVTQLSPFSIGFGQISSGAKGYCDYEERKILIKESMSQVQTVKTAIHEIAHATLHNWYNEGDSSELNKDRRTREVEAESVAYVVCQHYGIDTSDYSFGYIAGWSRDKELTELKSSLETIRSAASSLIDAIDSHLAEMRNEQEQAIDTGWELEV